MRHKHDMKRLPLGNVILRYIYIFGTYFLMLALFCAGKRLGAQALDQINIKKPVQLSGGLSATQTFYESRGLAARRDPYFWLISGNININVLGVFNIPLSGQISQQNKSYTQPFNQYGMSPTYKNWTGHFGYRSIQYSTYSLSGNQWLGGGIEYSGQRTPIYASAFWGRLQRAVGAFTQEGIVAGEVAYERYGYGTKMGYQKSGRQIYLVLFRAKDQAGSLDHTLADSLKKTPAENLVWAITTKQPISKYFNFDFEWATSAYTADSRNLRESSPYVLVNGLGDFFVTNNSTQVNNALQGGLQYSRPKYQIKLGYRRIDPEYKTMGSVFLNNDIEDISAGISWKMWKQKLNFNTTYGLQRNNLDKKLTQEMVRNAYAANVSYAATQKLNFNASYTNFLSNTKFNNTNISANQLSLSQNADSLRYNQVTESASLGSTYSTGDSLHKHNLNLMGSLQKARDSKANNSDFYTFMAGYNILFVKSKWNISTNALTSYNKLVGSVNQSVGPNLNLSKSFGTNVRLTYGITYAVNFVNQASTGNTVNNRLGMSYKIKKSHQINADVNYMNRTTRSSTQTNVSELRANLIYGYTF